MPRFVMIDLETLGSVPGCAIIAIGAVIASADGFVQTSFYRVVSRRSCLAVGLHESPATLEWWERQSPEARAVLAQAEGDAAETLDDALNALNSFVQLAGADAEVFGNGSDFDNAILAAAAHAAGIELGWKFYQNRCYRTLKNLAPDVHIARAGTHHNALDDARSQAEHLGRIRASMSLSSWQVDRALQFIEWMADTYRRRTARRVLGFRVPTMTRSAARHFARLTFDTLPIDEPFGHPAIDWTQASAAEFVDEDLRLWEA